MQYSTGLWLIVNCRRGFFYFINTVLVSIALSTAAIEFPHGFRLNFDESRQQYDINIILRISRKINPTTANSLFEIAYGIIMSTKTVYIDNWVLFWGPEWWQFFMKIFIYSSFEDFGFVISSFATPILRASNMEISPSASQVTLSPPILRPVRLFLSSKAENVLRKRSVPKRLEPFFFCTAGTLWGNVSNFRRGNRVRGNVEHAFEIVTSVMR